MITIDDIKIKVKTYNRKKNHVILNLIIFDQLEIRGYTVRYLPTKSSSTPVWVVTPPSVKVRNNTWFHIVRITNAALWEQLKKNIIDTANEHANSIS